MLQILEKHIFQNIYRRLNTWSPLATAFNSAVNYEKYSVNVSKKETVHIRYLLNCLII